jgi:hypothetical protein
MPTPNNPQDDLPEDRPEAHEDDLVPAGGRCAICEMAVSECDHLVASIDVRFSELVAGAIFAHERTILDLLEELAASDPDALKVAGASPVLEYVATLIRDKKDEGHSAGDAIAINFPHIMAALSYLLQEDEDVTATSIDADSEDDSSIENLWAQDPEWIVERLIGRLQEWTEEINEG